MSLNVRISLIANPRESMSVNMIIWLSLWVNSISKN